MQACPAAPKLLRADGQTRSYMAKIIKCIFF